VAKGQLDYYIRRRRKGRGNNWIDDRFILDVDGQEGEGKRDLF